MNFLRTIQLCLCFFQLGSIFGQEIVYEPGPTEQVIQIAVSQTDLALIIKNSNSKEYKVILNGQVIGTYEFAADLQFSPKSSRLSFVGFQNKRKWFLYADGKTQGAYSGIQKPLFRPGTDEFVYTYADAKGIYHLIKDKTELGAYSQVFELSWKGPGDSLVFVARSSQGQILVVGSQKYGPFKELAFRSLFVDGEPVYKVKIKDKDYLYAGKKEVAGAEYIGDYELVDGKLAFVTGRQVKQNFELMVNFDGRKYGPFLDVPKLAGLDGSFMFSASTDFETYKLFEGKTQLKNNISRFGILAGGEVLWTITRSNNKEKIEFFDNSFKSIFGSPTYDYIFGQDWTPQNEPFFAYRKDQTQYRWSKGTEDSPSFAELDAYGPRFFDENFAMIVEKTNVYWLGQTYGPFKINSTLHGPLKAQGNMIAILESNGLEAGDRLQVAFDGSQFIGDFSKSQVVYFDPEKGQVLRTGP